jgi:hypothetical protein
VIRQRPASVLVWAAIYAVIGLVSVLLIFPMMQPIFQKLMTMDPESPQSMAALQASMGGVQGLSWLLSFASYFLSAVLLCGAFRILLRPDEPGFASLRVGWDELRIFGIIVVLAFGAPFAVGLFALIVMLLGLLLGFALQSVPALQILLITLLVIAAIGAVLYAWVRISLIFPLTFLRRRLVVDEAWTLSRGRFWTLFAPYAVVFLIVALLSGLLMVPAAIWFFSQLPPFPAGQDPEAAGRAVFGVLERLFSQPFGLMGAFVLVSAVIQAISVALNGGVMAAAAYGFLADDGKLPEANIFE